MIRINDSGGYTLDEIIVSVLCFAYNHEKYIRQAIEGFLMQKTSFRIEILIHDDASTDKTQEIIKEYHEKYPNLIKTVLQTENQYSKGIDVCKFLINIAKGKYIAFCEGDDYWIDERKLEKQVATLKDNPECVASCHNQLVVKEDGELWPDEHQKQYREQRTVIHGKERILGSCKAFHTASLIMERRLFSDMTDDCFNEYFECKSNGDIKLCAVIFANGLLCHLAEDMACYRLVVSGNDSWSARNRGKNIFKITFDAIESVKAFISKHYNVNLDYSDYCNGLLSGSMGIFIKHPSKENFTIFRYLVKQNKLSLLDVLKVFISKVSKKLKK